jgi:membrane protein DedA with SNARE-associated domain
MAALVWVMVGLALWHFTIFLPDHFWAGIIGAFLGAVIGPLVFGILIHGGSIPGQSDTNLLSAIEAVPGALIGMGVVYWIGLRQERTHPATV